MLALHSHTGSEMPLELSIVVLSCFQGPASLALIFITLRVITQLPSEITQNCQAI